MNMHGKYTSQVIDMGFEQQLVHKTFYETLVEAGERDVVSALGEMFFAAHRDGADLSSIRFAQGEVYFHRRDYEAAIFKWEQVHRDDLRPWAQKNIADSCYELGRLELAEELYRSIETESETLQAEIMLRLFSLYRELGENAKADDMIKRGVSRYPDYPNMTEWARAFFEEQGDWESALELALGETLRTSARRWVDILIGYVEQGHARTMAPERFSRCLALLYETDRVKFERLVQALWNGYRDGDLYFSWLAEWNRLYEELAIGRDYDWKRIPSLLGEAYAGLMKGPYRLKELVEVVPPLVKSWMSLADGPEAAEAAAALLAWSEKFPEAFQEETINDAAKRLVHAKRPARETGVSLFDEIADWAEEQRAGSHFRFRWVVRQLSDSRTHYVLVAGASRHERLAFLRTLVGEAALAAPSAPVLAWRNGGEMEVAKISDDQFTVFSSIDEFQQAAGGRASRFPDDAVIECAAPFSLVPQGIVLLDIGPLGGRASFDHEAFVSFSLADSVLFLLNGEDPLSSADEQLLLRLHERAPHAPMYVLLPPGDGMVDEEETARMVEEVEAHVRAIVPEARVIVYSPHAPSRKQQQALIGLLEEMRRCVSPIRREEAILTTIGRFIAHLFRQRAEAESRLAELVVWKREMAAKLSGAIHQLGDLQEEKTVKAAKSFHTVLADMRGELSTAIPDLLRNMAELVSEDSDFSRLPLELNDKANERLRAYLNEEVLPKLRRAMEQWIAATEDEFNECQAFLREMGEGFNAMFGEERLKLECEFRILADWRRDTDRLISGAQMEKVNIFLRRTPSQLLLKGAGKLLGAFAQNKAMLAQKYKQFIQTQDYAEAAEAVIEQLLLPFEWFAKSLERDVAQFFHAPLTELKETLKQLELEIAAQEGELKHMRKNPEAYRDPLVLFGIRLRQCEQLAQAASAAVHLLQDENKPIGSV
ncbi:tetratricopeptide repeat protein [Geobacillus thermocatenulatus]|uniref:tetratricopeptide repeat protein n=1 Tax=Geobacillus thermocatenulatus TaxID=33938 RepID=UPI00047359F2|nr:GTP-binding protein [Geobacillus thermocatenulatus]